MAPKLYTIASSAVCRSVLLTEAALGLSLDHVEVNVLKGEHLKPEFLKLNPLHTLPTLVDGTNVIIDSSAINVYLVEKYGTGSPLYPNDPYKKAVVNQMLHFGSGDLFPAARQVIKPIMMYGVKEIRPDDAAELVNAYQRLETLLDGRVWAAGNELTLADFALIPTVTSSHVAVPIDEAKFCKISAWLTRAKQLPYYDRNQKGDEEFKVEFLRRLSTK